MSTTEENDSVFWAYAKWHYGQGFKELLALTQNLLWFISYFFSFRPLSQTLFKPWQMGENYSGGFDWRKYVPAVCRNFIAKLLGFLVKIIILAIGATAYIFFFAVSFLAAILWLLMPAILLGSAVLSVTFFVI